MSADQIRAAEVALANARAEADTAKIIQAEQALSKARNGACDGE